MGEGDRATCLTGERNDGRLPDRGKQRLITDFLRPACPSTPDVVPGTAVEQGEEREGERNNEDGQPVDRKARKSYATVTKKTLPDVEDLPNPIRVGSLTRVVIPQEAYEEKLETFSFALIGKVNFRYAFDKIYSLDSTAMEKFNLVKSTLARLFEEYWCMEITEEERGFQSHAIEDNTVGDVLDWEELSMYESSTTTVIQDKSELDLYLEEPRIKDPTKHYDVLAFWKSQGSKYRDLSRMARDVLAIPVSTVASESAFSAGGRVIDKYRSKLLPTNAEALICLRDWMFGVDFRAEPVDDASDLANALGNVLSLDVSGDTNITVEPTQRSSNASTAANV